MNNEEQFKDSLRKIVESKEFPPDIGNWEAMQRMMQEQGLSESTEELQFKDTLQKLSESKEFVFDESDWEKAAALMPSASRGRLLLYALPALVALLSGVLTYFYFITPLPPAKAQALQRPVKHPATNKNPELPKPQAIEAPHATGIPTPAQGAAKLSEEPATKPNFMAGSFTKAPEKVNTIASADQPAKAAATPQADAVHTDKPTVPVSASPVATPSQAVVQQTPRDAQSSSDSQQTDLAPAPSVTAADTKQEQATTQPGEKTAPSTDTPAAVATPSQLPVAENTVSAQNANAPETATLPAVETPSTVAAAKRDSAATLVVIPDSLLQKIKHKRLIMNFEAGGDYLTGWKNAGKTDANGFNPVIGFNYYNYVADKLAVSIGAQYTTVSHLSYYSHTSKITYFDLGVQNSVTVITPLKLQYLAVPVKINYFMDEKSSFGAGVNFAYLLSSNSRVQTYDELLGQRSNQKTYRASGYTEGFAAFDTQISLFYRRRIYKNFSVNAEFVYGLTDVKNNGFFNSNATERNTGLKLTLQYNLFR